MREKLRDRIYAPWQAWVRYLINISITRRVALSQVGNWIQVRSGNRACPGTSSDTNHIVSCKVQNGFLKEENQFRSRLWHQLWPNGAMTTLKSQPSARNA